MPAFMHDFGKNGAPEKHLLCYSLHLNLFESDFPILNRLHQRGNIAVDLVVSKRMVRKDPRLAQVFAETGLHPRLEGRLWFHALSYPTIKRADAVLSASDPYANYKKTRLRDRYLVASGTPLIHVQHGLLQTGLNRASPDGGDNLHLFGHHWYADLMLWWEDFAPAQSDFIQDDIADQVKKVGFIKQNFLPIRPPDPATRTHIARFRQRLLLCTSFDPYEPRTTDRNIADFYAMLDDFCTRNPDIFVLLRPHRGQPTTTDTARDTAMVARHQNLMVVKDRHGPFAGSSIHDNMALCDGLVSHASTAVLDGLYGDLPTGVLDNDCSKLAGLPQVRDLAALEGFMARLVAIDPKNNAVRRHFGELDDNLDHAAELIEQAMHA